MTRPVETLRRAASRIEEAALVLERSEAALLSENRTLTQRLDESEGQVDRLLNLYAAAYQLHASLDPSQVLDTIADIAMHLLGFEQFALLLPSDDGVGHQVCLERGLNGTASRAFASGRYRGGDPVIDATLAGGGIRVGPEPRSMAHAVVPLLVQGTTVGALVLIKLLDHKQALRVEDRDMLELLAAHAASALFAARSFASTDRKVRTLEALVRLVRGN